MRKNIIEASTRCRPFIFMTVLGLLIVLMATPCINAGTFRDDFEDGDLEGWRQLAPPGPILWKIVDGELEASKLGNKSTALITGEATWADYTIEYDVKLLEYHGKGDIHILARVQELQQLLIFNIGDFCAPAGICVQGIPDAVSAQEKFEQLELNEWHHLKLEVKGREFVLWVNGDKVLLYEDKTTKTGAVGFGLTNYTARFDNVEISGPDVPDLTPRTWEVQPVQPRNKLATTWSQIKANR